MLIYLDLLFFLNWWIDFLLLITTNIILKQSINKKRTIIASFFGALSTFTFFINNDSILIMLKIIICFIMQLIMNGYKGMKTISENVFYFYLSSVILAGFIYLFQIEKTSIKEKYLLLFLITPIILYLSNRKIKKIESYYKEIYEVVIIYNKKQYKFNALLDTGNNLYDQYKRRPISLIYSNKIKFDYNNGLLVPIETANKKSLLKCIKVDKMIIDDKEYKNAIIGLSNNKFNIQDINMILHKDIIGGLK